MSDKRQNTQNNSKVYDTDNLKIANMIILMYEFMNMNCRSTLSSDQWLVALLAVFNLTYQGLRNTDNVWKFSPDNTSHVHTCTHDRLSVNDERPIF